MGLSETVSKKGRPRKFSDDVYQQFAAIYRGKTERTIRNAIYAAIARRVLMQAGDFSERFPWLENRGNTRPRIMTELGYLYHHGWVDDATLIELADKLCVQQPRTNDAVYWLSGIRYQ